MSIYKTITQHIIITAEIGINHNGDLQTALAMIDAAAASGADAVKFQAFKTESMYSRLTPGFQHTQQDVFSQIKALEIQDAWWPQLKDRARSKGLLFSASIFDQPSLDIMARVGIDFIKIASAEVNNLDFIVSQKGLSDTYVVSTGTANLEEVSALVRRLRSEGIEKIILLECTSAYPAAAESIHLLNIDFLAETFGLPAGFSDHTLGWHHAVAAAARGARFIEKHFTLDKNMPGPDQRISCEPEELKALVGAVREIEVSLKTNRKGFQVPQEANSREIGRKSLIALRAIKKGELITADNTIIKRPGLGIPPGEVGFVYGRAAKRDIAADQWITWEMV